MALVIVYVCLPKKKIKLPKSLASVVRSQVNSNFDIKPEGKYISIVTSSADKMVSPESEDENTVDPIGFITKDKTVDLSNSGNTVADGSEDTSDGAVEINIEEGLVVEVSGGNPDPEDNYSKSVGGQEDTCNNLSILCPDVQQPGVAKSSRNIGGYDKPHWQDTHPEAESLVT